LLETIDVIFSPSCRFWGVILAGASPFLIPEALAKKEVAYRELSDLRVVGSISEITWVQ